MYVQQLPSIPKPQLTPSSRFVREFLHLVPDRTQHGKYISERYLPLLVKCLCRGTKTCLSFRDSISRYMQVSKNGNVDSEMYLGRTMRLSHNLPTLLQGSQSQSFQVVHTKQSANLFGRAELVSFQQERKRRRDSLEDVRDVRSRS